MAPREHIATLPKVDPSLTLVTEGRLEFGGILKLLEVMFVRAVPHVHFRLQILAALLALLPAPGMPFGKVQGTKRVPVVVPRATVAGIGKQSVLMFVVTDPVSAALRLPQVLRFAA
jgi:hypothetical protein